MEVRRVRDRHLGSGRSKHYSDKWTLGGFSDLVELVTDASLAAVIAPNLPEFRGAHVHVLTVVGKKFGGDGATGATMIPRNMPGFAASAAPGGAPVTGIHRDRL